MGARRKPVPKEPHVAAERGEWTDGASTARWLAFEAPIRLVTLDSTAVIWTSGGLPEVTDAIVRVIPPADATDERIGAVLDAVRAAGAVATKLLPRVSGPMAVLPEVPRPARRRHRDVVNELVAESVGVDREALARIVGDVMDQEGL